MIVCEILSDWDNFSMHLDQSWSPVRFGLAKSSFGFRTVRKEIQMFSYFLVEVYIIVCFDVWIVPCLNPLVEMR